MTDKRRREQHIPPRPEVLIVVSSGGVVDVYTSRHIPVLIAQTLRGLPDTAEAEIACEEYLERSLPLWAKELYLPENLQATATIRLRTPSEDIERRTKLKLVRLAAKIREEHDAATKQKDGGTDSGVQGVPGLYQGEGRTV